MVVSYPVESWENSTVASLIDSLTRQWNADVIDGLFAQEEADIIKEFL